MLHVKRVAVCAYLAVAVGCPSETNQGDGSSGGTDTSGISISATTDPSATTLTTMTDSATTDMSASATTTTSATDTESTTDGPTSTDPDTGSGSSDSTGNDPDNPVDCGGNVYACGDGMDNDEDGNTDLMDPECTGPCDDDESSFQTGLPGDNMDCKQDCFFDGNSGQGDDGCIWDLRCDPENPGGNIGCEYTGGNNCENQPPNQDEGCIMFCEQFVPPGCDCFGCCEVDTPDGPVHIFLNSGPECSLENLDGCETCTYQIDDCGVPCEPEMCELCFGQDELPEGCDDQMCEIGDPCDTNTDCPTDFYCLLGCCYPPPPG